jgi:hypothetical protein
MAVRRILRCVAPSVRRKVRPVMRAPVTPQAMSTMLTSLSQRLKDQRRTINAAATARFRPRTETSGFMEGYSFHGGKERRSGDRKG